MDLTSLEIFQAVAAELSVTRAAAVLGRAQSNVTTRIQALEQQLGVDLFVREGRRLSLTDQGKLFLDYSQRLLALAEEAVQVLHPGQPQGTLRIGSMESTAAARLPGVMIGFQQRWPGVRLAVRTGTTQALLDLLGDGLVDCAFVALTVEEGSTVEEELAQHGLAGVAVFEEQLVAVLPAGYAEAGTPLTLAAFATGCTYRRLGQQWLAEQRDVAVSLTHEVASYHAMFACVVAGQSLCIAPTSLLALQPASQAITTRPIATVATWLVYRKAGRTAAVDAFTDLALASQR
ncbi:LysR family transcriptional regulator [Pseudomonas vanderleydeniana]|uniref:LysR family transcriptional regulator n=1 Tax=Pseudomonas vanderleydeniana TaxID=2745495 RepID=A0A9E6TR11_9PSED|nr:LysR family transcriptional regulator [Pseudomonas vanderleydeniana]QXI26520.1 LysR family transcriptional regulator [Pseudomonas vanderleydeniana]